MTPDHFKPEHVLQLVTELDGEYHDVLDAHIRAAIQRANTAVVELSQIDDDGNATGTEFFAVTVNRIPMESL